MNQLASYSLYMCSFAVSIFWSYVYEKIGRKGKTGKKFFWGILIALPIIIIQGFRYDVGTDYFSYLELFNGFSNNNQTYILWYSTEPLFILYCRLLYPISHLFPYIFFLMDAVIANVLLFSIVNFYGKYVSMPCMYLFYYTWCFPYFLNAERQGIAVLIVWYAMRYVYEKKPYRFLICILVATLIHNTAVIGFLLYLYNFITQGKKGYLKKFLITGSLLLPFFLEMIIDFLGRYFSVFAKYKKFTNVRLDTDKINTNFLITVFLIVILMFMWKILKKSEIDAYWILFLCVLQAVTYLLGNFIDYGFRMSFYFEFGLFYGYAHCLRNLHYKSNRRILMLFLVSICVFYFTYKFCIQGNCEVFPYRFIS